MCLFTVYTVIYVNMSWVKIMENSRFRNAPTIEMNRDHVFFPSWCLMWTLNGALDLYLPDLIQCGSVDKIIWNYYWRIHQSIIYTTYPWGMGNLESVQADTRQEASYTLGSWPMYHRAEWCSFFNELLVEGLNQNIENIVLIWTNKHVNLTQEVYLPLGLVLGFHLSD